MRMNAYVYFPIHVSALGLEAFSEILALFQIHSFCDVEFQALVALVLYGIVEQNPNEHINTRASKVLPCF